MNLGLVHGSSLYLASLRLLFLEERKCDASGTPLRLSHTLSTRRYLPLKCTPSRDHVLCSLLNLTLALCYVLAPAAQAPARALYKEAR